MSSSKGPIFRMFNPSARSKEENVEKRREQVRRAQNVYRQRKTRYVKALEADLAASRRRESDMSSRESDLEGQVRTLLHLLERHSIAVPDLGVVLKDEKSASPGGLQLVSSPGTHDEWPRASTVCSPLPSLSQSPASDPILSLPICDFDETVIGMQFVLNPERIEEPCLGHVHGDPARPDDPTNHALTVTSQLLCSSTSQHSPPKRSSLLPVQDVPSDILRRLLALAPAVSREDELTPVQAWDSLRRKPVTGSLQLRTVMNLAERLRDTAKCHGFGAVLDSAVFDRLIGELMRTAIGSHLSATGMI